MNDNIIIALLWLAIISCTIALINTGATETTSYPIDDTNLQRP